MYNIYNHINKHGKDSPMYNIYYHIDKHGRDIPMYNIYYHIDKHGVDLRYVKGYNIYREELISYY